MATIEYLDTTTVFSVGTGASSTIGPAPPPIIVYGKGKTSSTGGGSQSVDHSGEHSFKFKVRLAPGETQDRWGLIVTSFFHGMAHLAANRGTENPTAPLTPSDMLMASANVKAGVVVYVFEVQSGTQIIQPIRLTSGPLVAYTSRSIPSVDIRPSFGDADTARGQISVDPEYDVRVNVTLALSAYAQASRNPNTIPAPVNADAEAEIEFQQSNRGRVAVHLQLY